MNRNSILRTMFVAVVAASMTGFVYWKVTNDEQRRALEAMQALNDEITERLAEREAALERLGRSHRLAHLIVDGQAIDHTGAITDTALTMIELDDDGGEIARQTFKLPGSTIYLDAWTAKFHFDDVAGGHPFAGRTLVLLRRMYSDQLAPSDGIALDLPGAIPAGYAASDQSLYEQRIWQSFWDLSSDAALARAMGIRVAQGEAVYKRMRTGQRYELRVDAAGGINLTPLANDDAITFASESP